MSTAPEHWTSGPGGHYDSLLGLCSRPTPTAPQREQIRALAPTYPGWGTLVERAAAFGLAPLVASHLRSAGVEVPPGVHRRLQAVRLQERRRLQVRQEVLREVVDWLAARSVPCLALKGAVVGPLLYPDPSLRATTDLDLLLPHTEARGAWEAMRGELGFRQAGTQGKRHRHLGELALDRDGVHVLVELHTRLGPAGGGPRFQDIPTPHLQVAVGGGHVASLPWVELVRHVHKHGFGEPLGLWEYMFHAKAVADLVALVEGLADDVWSEVVSALPGFVDSVRMIHWLTPLHGRARQRIEPLGDRPEGVGQWERPRFEDLSRVPVLRGRDQRREAERVSEWWLRLRHGGAGPADVPQHRERHRRELARARRAF